MATLNAFGARGPGAFVLTSIKRYQAPHRGKLDGGALV